MTNISPSYYKYISFIADSSTKTSPVYDHANQINSILDENSYPYTFVGDTFLGFLMSVYRLHHQ